MIFSCLDNAISDDNFADLTEELIKELIPAIGLRIEFLKKWSAMVKPGQSADVSIGLRV